MQGCFDSVRPLNRLLRRRSVLAVVAVVAWASGAGPAPAQTLPSPSSGREARPATGLSSSLLVLVTSDSIDRERSYQLREGVPTGQSLLLRSASSLTARLQGPPGTWRAAGVAPEFLAVTNSSLPFSQNYGALWAGRGFSTRTLTGFRLERDRLRIIFAPEIILSANANWPLFQDYYHPAVPAGYSPFYFPYYVGRFTIDQPMRFGDKAIRRIDLGQTSILTSLGSVEIGFSNENEWWGPGIRNAIVLSNNAPGFPHLLVRTLHPITTRLGDVEMRWLVGGLKESAYFDTVSTNNSRSLASIAATLQTRWDPNLSIGLARSVYGTETGSGQFLLRWFDVFARTHLDVPDTSRTQRDQLFTLFGRWVFPADGVEIYTEWGRTELRPSLRDFLVAPNHTQGYTIGLQWTGGKRQEGAFRIQSEITQLEQSATFRDEPLGSWYTSTRVIQGYTNRGETLGASIGPGASSQWLAVDYLKPEWQLGAFIGRIRWNQDVHNHAGLPIYESYCSMDLSLYPGVRGGRQGRLGSLTAELSIQNRLTPFFQNGGGCPNNGRRLDIQNSTLSITFSPFSRR
jgi:hypothetical protein